MVMSDSQWAVRQGNSDQCLADERQQWRRTGSDKAMVMSASQWAIRQGNSDQCFVMGHAWHTYSIQKSGGQNRTRLQLFHDTD
eukprot:1160729-Pelagomonas_calceolata.AAC.15